VRYPIQDGTAFDPCHVHGEIRPVVGQARSRFDRVYQLNDRVHSLLVRAAGVRRPALRRDAVLRTSFA
jgi:hypothetical protein